MFVGNGTYGYINGIPAPAHAYTMEAWVDADDDGDAMIMQQGGGGALYVTGGKYTFREVDTTVTAGVGPTVGHFDHVVGTWDGRTARIYVNGQLSASAPATKSPSGESTFYIGYGDLAPWFRGYLDEAAYYDHALAPDRVLAHYEADPPPPLWIPYATPHAGDTAPLSVPGGNAQSAAANLAAVPLSRLAIAKTKAVAPVAKTTKVTAKTKRKPAKKATRATRTTRPKKTARHQGTAPTATAKVRPRPKSTRKATHRAKATRRATRRRR